MKRDNLPADLPIEGQTYAILSIVGPHLKQKTNVWGIKIRGVGETIKDCENIINEIKSYDDKFDMYIAEVGKFLALDVSPEQIKEQKYLTEELNDIMGNYFKEGNKQAKIVEKKAQNAKMGVEEKKESLVLWDKIVFTKRYIEERSRQIESLKETLERDEKTFENNYSQEEREEAKHNYDSTNLDNIFTSNEQFSTDIDTFKQV
jgi:hypothetical protein